MSSARVADSGTVAATSAKIRSVDMNFLSAKAVYMADLMAASISAPEKPREAATSFCKSKSATFCLWRASCTWKIARRSVVLGRSTKNSSSKRPLRMSSGGKTKTLLQVAATKTGALRSCIQPRKAASRRELTPASTEAESGPLPAKTFSSSSIHSTAGASCSATANILWMCFSVSPTNLS